MDQKLHNLFASTDDNGAVYFNQLKNSQDKTNINNKRIENLNNDTNNTDAVNLIKVNNLIQLKFKMLYYMILDMEKKIKSFKM